LPTSGPRIRLGAALTVGAVLFALQVGTAAQSPAAPRHRLLPDLVTMRIHSDDLEVSGDRAVPLLRLTNRLANKGRGPLEIRPSAISHDCDHDGDPANDRDAVQRVFLDGNGNGVFQRKADTASERFRFGCERYDPRVQHWNVADLARYELRRRRSGKTVARTTKVAYCAVDSELRFPGLPGSPSRRYYPRGGCDEGSTLGISIGWVDEYYYTVPGQALEIAGVKAGRYCLVSIGDPHDLLRESDNSNNARKTRIELDPSNRTVNALSGRCRLRR
jgi:hypothetical protein